MNNFPIIIVDVGASIGLFTEHVLKTNANTYVYAIEPNLKVNLESLQKLQKTFPTRLRIFPYALSNTSGIAHFYGAGIIGGQIGSLNPLNMESSKFDLLAIDKTRFLNEDIDYVKTKTVNEFITDSGLEKISFLKIDAQGSDIEILRIFLDLIQIDCAVLEVDTFEHSASNLYNVNNSFDKLIELIPGHALRIIKIIPNSDLSEFNVFLAKDTEKAMRLIQELNIDNSIAFGKFTRILGINKISQKKPESNFPLIKKIIRGFSHPRKSLISLYARIIG